MKMKDGQDLTAGFHEFP